MMKEKKSFLVYFDWETPFDQLNNERLGELFRAMLKYAKSEIEPEFDDPTLSIIFSFVKTALDRDRIAYEERCRKNSENAKKGAGNRAKATEPDTNIPHDFNTLLKTIS